jgi:hypothetical protein
MLPPDGWRLQAELYSPASNKASSRPQAVRVLQLFDSPLTHDPTPGGLSGETAETRSEVACDGHVTGDERHEVPISGLLRLCEHESHTRINLLLPPVGGTSVYSPPHTLYAESVPLFEDAVARAALFRRRSS